MAFNSKLQFDWKSFAVTFDNNKLTIVESLWLCAQSITLCNVTLFWMHVMFYLVYYTVKFNSIFIILCKLFLSICFSLTLNFVLDFVFSYSFCTIYLRIFVNAKVVSRTNWLEKSCSHEILFGLTSSRPKVRHALSNETCQM